MLWPSFELDEVADIGIESSPVAFYKGVDSGAKAKKITGEPAPDVEEAFEAEDEVPEEDEGDVAGGDASDDEADISKVSA